MPATASPLLIAGMLLHCICALCGVNVTYVGNKPAVLPLQLLGFDVDPVYTVQVGVTDRHPRNKGHVVHGASCRSIWQPC
jgi:pyridoxal/pyridoxine/pyridoxamine kinase